MDSTNTQSHCSHRHVLCSYSESDFDTGRQYLVTMKSLFHSQVVFYHLLLPPFMALKWLCDLPVVTSSTDMWTSFLKWLLKSPYRETHLNVPVLNNSTSLNTSAHFILILECRNAAQDLSKPGICHPVAGTQQQPQRKIFQGCSENKG